MSSSGASGNVGEVERAAMKRGSDLQSVVLACNGDGMEFLRKGNVKAAFEQLKYAEAVLLDRQDDSSCFRLLAITCNNLGCYYKRTGKLHAALSYLRRSLKIDVGMQTDDVAVGGTHLNLCAILSKLNKHAKALQHALCALELIGNRISLVSSYGTAASKDDYATLAIAYHNVGVEREFLHNWDEAAMAYRQGREVGLRCLGEKHPLVVALTKSCEAVLEKAARAAKHAPAVAAGGKKEDRSPRKAEALLVRQDTRTLSEDAGRPASTPSEAVGDKEPPPGTSPDGFETDLVGRGYGTRDSAASEGFPAFAQDHDSYEDEAAHQPYSTAPQAYSTAQQPPQYEDPPSSAPQYSDPRYGMSQSSAPFVPPSPQYNAQYAEPMYNAPYGGLPMPYGGTSASYGAWAPAELAEADQELGFLPPAAEELRRPRSEAYARPAARADPPPLARVDGPMPVAQPRSDEPVAFRPRSDSPPPLVLSQPIAPDGPRPARSRPTAAIVTAPLPPRGGSGGGTVRPIARPVRGPKKAVVEKRAAERIQRCWRREKDGVVQRRELRKVQQAAATKIQARYRAFRVVRRKKTAGAVTIQRFARGFVVRRRLLRKKAAMMLQRGWRGARVRNELRRLHLVAEKMQARVRSHLARKTVGRKRMDYDGAARTTQSAFRGHKARKEVMARRREQKLKKEEQRGAVLIQKVHRGKLERKKTDVLFAERKADKKMILAVVRIQCKFRQIAAKTRVAGVRKDFHFRRANAATQIQRIICGFLARKKYHTVLEELASQPGAVVVLQRFARGFLIRKRMLEAARRAEQELWATAEIQRMWRGYRGRLAWEAKYEESWSREVASLRIQRAYRGFRARVRALGMRKRFIRAEFAIAKRFFRSAQCLQARFRGVLERKQVEQRKERVVKGIVTIQRIFRGHRLRFRLWEMVLDERATRIQSHARGMLVRSRAALLVYHVSLLQRNIRTFLVRRRRKQEVVRSAEAALAADAARLAADAKGLKATAQVHALAAAEEARAVLGDQEAAG